MAAQRVQMAAQEARMVASGLVAPISVAHVNLPSVQMQDTTAQLLAQVPDLSQNKVYGQEPTNAKASSQTQAQGNGTNTPTRKRHSSQQFGGLAKDTRITVGSIYLVFRSSVFRSPLEY
jgi:hypothetical protein